MLGLDTGVSPASGRRAAALEPDLLQVGVRRETSRLVARVDELFIDDDVELARLARANLDGPAPASFNPSLHTEGFGFVVSGGTVMYENSHGHCLVCPKLAPPHAPGQFTGCVRKILALQRTRWRGAKIL
jgi:hypothetical protein